MKPRYLSFPVCLLLLVSWATAAAQEPVAGPESIHLVPREYSRFVLTLTGALPDDAQLILHLGRHDEEFRQAWGETAGVWTLAKDVDGSGLRVENGRLRGRVIVNTARPARDGEEPADSPGAMLVLDLDVQIDGQDLRGSFNGTRAWRIGNRVVTPEGKLALEIEDLQFATREPEPVAGQVVGRVRTAAELRAAHAVAPGRDWPNYHGPRGAFAATSGGHQLVESFSQARLLWKSEFTPPARCQSRRYGEGNLTRFMERGAAGGECSPVVQDGRVFVYYVDPAGEEMDAYWQQSIEAGRRVVRKQWHARADDVFLCIDAATGQTLWQQRFPLAGSNEIASKGSFTHTMAVSDGIAIGRGSGGITYAFDAETGRLLWSRNIGGGHASTIIDGVLFHARGGGSLDMPLIAFDARTGERLWESPRTTGRMALPLHWEHEGKHYVIAGTAAGTVRCIHARSGEVLWEQPDVGANVFSLQNDGDYLVANTAPAGEPAAPGGFRITAAGLEPLWVIPADKIEHHTMRCPPVIADGHAWLRSQERPSRLIVVEMETGRITADVADVVTNFFYIMDGVIIADRDTTHSSTIIGMAAADPANPRLFRDEWVTVRHRQTSGYWNHPIRHAVFDGRIIIRGARGMYCYDLRAE